MCLWIRTHVESVFGMEVLVTYPLVVHNNISAFMHDLHSWGCDKSAETRCSEGQLTILTDLSRFRSTFIWPYYLCYRVIPITGRLFWGQGKVCTLCKSSTGLRVWCGYKHVSRDVRMKAIWEGAFSKIFSGSGNFSKIDFQLAWFTLITGSSHSNLPSSKSKRNGKQFVTRDAVSKIQGFHVGGDFSKKDKTDLIRLNKFPFQKVQIFDQRENGFKSPGIPTSIRTQIPLI